MLNFIFGFFVGIVAMVAVSLSLCIKSKKNSKYIMIELNDHAD